MRGSAMRAAACIARPNHSHRQALSPPGLRICVSSAEARAAGAKRRTRPLHRRPRAVPRSSAQGLSARSFHRERAGIANGRRFYRPQRLTAQGKENLATRTAALVIPAVGNNYLRHEKLQRFMLANDSVTVAVEVPIWLTRPTSQHLSVTTASDSYPKVHRTTKPSPAISTFCRSAMARCISSTTNQTPAPTARWRSSPSMPWHSPGSPGCVCSTSMRVVQRAAILRIFLAHGARPYELRCPPPPLRASLLP